jgi:hypothetical protein
MLRILVICAAFLLSSCEDFDVPTGPTEAQMKEAYLGTSDILLGNELLSGNLQLSEFKRMGCTPASQGLYRCKFYAKLGLSASGDEGQLIDHLIGSQSGYFREATFFQNPEGKWLCVDVVNSSSNDAAAMGQ